LKVLGIPDVVGGLQTSALIGTHNITFLEKFSIRVSSSIGRGKGQLYNQEKFSLKLQ